MMWIQVNLLKMILSKDIVSAVENLDFVKAVDCYPKTFIAYNNTLELLSDDVVFFWCSFKRARKRKKDWNQPPIY